MSISPHTGTLPSSLKPVASSICVNSNSRLPERAPHYSFATDWDLGVPAAALYKKCNDNQRVLDAIDCFDWCWAIGLVSMFLLHQRHVAPFALQTWLDDSNALKGN
ncbi:hypothetical protein L1987_74233 [Smallanthus sonchifolius]|uniref:Uncharacterized protein n=1 Tax=Smallanthus sonchifolius TaxID=185202 RepID=A0ACB9A3P3_9ASTR|nr:hypothetical protein L1987_74233 [Smallanthus sonchifolius]